jgi:ribosomal protein S18 acetylase RimI-like enzyme
MMIQKAAIHDHGIIMNIIRDAIADMVSRGIDQWDGIYPSAEIIRNDLQAETLYVGVGENIIKGLMVLNESQVKEYGSVKWRYTSGKQLIIHRLCIAPKYQGQGIARLMLEFAGKYGKQNHYQSIRLDAFTANQRACNLYEHAGYRIAGTVTFRKGQFYCFEKNLLA